MVSRRPASSGIERGWIRHSGLVSGCTIILLYIYLYLFIFYIYIYIYYCQGVMELLENARVTLVRMRPMEGSEGGSGSWAVRICFIWFYMNIYMNI